MRGRPQTPADERKDVRTYIRFTADEYARIKEQAEKEDRSVTNYLRQIILERINPAAQ